MQNLDQFKFKRKRNITTFVSEVLSNGKQKVIDSKKYITYASALPNIHSSVTLSFVTEDELDEHSRIKECTLETSHISSNFITYSKIMQEFLLLSDPNMLNWHNERLSSNSYYYHLKHTISPHMMISWFNNNPELAIGLITNNYGIEYLAKNKQKSVKDYTNLKTKCISEIHEVLAELAYKRLYA